MNEQICGILPPHLIPAWSKLFEQTEELRLRMGHPPHYVVSQKEMILDKETINESHLQYVLHAATRCSLYAVNDTLCHGYITIPGGHRVGICGKAVMEGGAVKTIKDISSVSIRVATERQGVAPAVDCSTLIAGPPGCGKTTLLRDCVRLLSENTHRVCLIDERGEVAGCVRGVPQFHLGSSTDIMTGCPKAIAVPMVLRTMNPQWIAVDEITQSKDVCVMEEAGYCGVRLLATAHIWDKSDLENRPIYASMLRRGIFREILFLTPEHRWRKEVI